jgi:protein TonB
LGLLCASTGASGQDAAKPTESPAAQATEQRPPTRVQLSEKEMKKLFVKRVKPDYPPLAELARVVGACRLRIVVGADGNVRNIQLVYGHPMLGPAAIKAAKESKYRPYLVNGQPVEAEGEVEYYIPY